MDDLIGRQDAIDALAYFTEKSPTGRTAQEVVKALPSAKPERKKGKWLSGDCKGAFCSECEEYYAFEPRKNYAFCPNCGADMRGDMNDKF